MQFPDLRKRLLTGTLLGLSVLVLIIVAFFSCSARWVLVGLGLFAVVLAAVEYAVFASRSLKKQALLICILLCPVLFVLAGMCTSPGCAVLVTTLPDAIWLYRGCVAAFLATGIMAACAGRCDLQSVQNVLAELPVALILIGIGGASLVMLAMVPNSPAALLWLLLTVIANDVSAYFAGVRFGGPKLSPSLSPKKTFSGSTGGFCGGLLVGLASSGLLHGYSLAECSGLSLVVVLAGQLGDLLKSYLKRLHDVKDSGKILPGHGGVFDRIDGILAASPIVLMLCL